MSANKYYVKFPVSKLEGVSVEDVVNLFHQWIREEKADKVLLDVADYTHVPNGPGVMLVGFYENLQLTLNAKEPAFIVTYKRPLEGETQDKISHILAKATFFADKIEKALDGLTLNVDQFQIGLNDRLKDVSVNQNNIEEAISKLNDSISLGWKTSLHATRDPKKLPEVIINSETKRGLSELATLLK